MARKKCWKCKWSGGKLRGVEAGVHCNYSACHEKSRTIQAYEACGVKQATEETDRMLSGYSCAFFEPGARVYKQVDSVMLPGSIPHATPLEARRRNEYDWELARKLHAEGKNDARIAEVLGCSDTTVCSWRAREGLPAVPAARHPVYDWAKALEMRNAGATIRKIASALGCHPTTVEAWLTREGLRKPPTDWKRGRELFDQGRSAAEISAAIGVKERTVEDWARREGLVWTDARAAPAS